MDLNLPDTDGVELLRLLVTRDCKAHILLLCGVERASANDGLRGRHEPRPFDVRDADEAVLPADLQTKLASVLKQDRAIDAAELDRGIAAGEIVPYYQPKASLKEQRGWLIEGVEALVRWQHPRIGLVMPDEFMPLAERSGVIGELTGACSRSRAAASARSGMTRVCG